MEKISLTIPHMPADVQKHEVFSAHHNIALAVDLVMSRIQVDKQVIDVRVAVVVDDVHVADGHLCIVRRIDDCHAVEDEFGR